MKYDSEVDLFRVWVLRMNMVCKVGRGAARVKGVSPNYGTTKIHQNNICRYQSITGIRYGLSRKACSDFTGPVSYQMSRIKRYALPGRRVVEARASPYLGQSHGCCHL